MSLTTVVNGTTSDAAQVNQYRDLFLGGLVFDAKNGYGATGNGVSDDTAAIMVAITAAETAGGIVYLAPGTYVVTTLTLPSKVELVGAGVSATTLKLKNSTNAAVIQTTGAAALIGTDSSGGTHSWAVRNLTIDGNKANNTSVGYGIRAYGYGFQLEHVRVKDCKTNGIYSGWGSGTGATAPFDMMAYCADVSVQDTGGYGWEWAGPHDSVFVGCYAIRSGTGYAGFVFDGYGGGNTLVGCHSYGLGTYWAYVLGTTGNNLIACVGEGAGTSDSLGGQVYVGANDNGFNGCFFYSAGAGTPAYSVRGICIGDDESADIASTVISGTRIVACNGGAIALTADGGTSVDARVWQASGAAVTGTVNVDTELLVSVSGGATYIGNRTKSFGLPDYANAQMGTETLTAGKCQVFTTAITDNSHIFLTVKTPGGTTGVLVAENIGGTDRSAGEWFYVSSMTTAGAVQTLDTSTFEYLLIEGFST